MTTRLTNLLAAGFLASALSVTPAGAQDHSAAQPVERTAPGPSSNGLSEADLALLERSAALIHWAGRPLEIGAALCFFDRGARVPNAHALPARAAASMQALEACELEVRLAHEAQSDTGNVRRAVRSSVRIAQATIARLRAPHARIQRCMLAKSATGDGGACIDEALATMQTPVPGE